MKTERSIVGAALILSWALLLSARCVCAGIYGAQVGSSYDVGLSRIGWIMPLAAWICFVTGAFLGGSALFSRPKP
jgi:4-hydroxybenzoate polyprenyltransferase